MAYTPIIANEAPNEACQLSGMGESVKVDFIIRAASVADLPSINAIYNYYVAHSTCVWTTTACSEAERVAWYEEHGTSMPVLVAEAAGRVVGWSALGSFRTAYTLAGTLEDSVYVHHDFHRQGIGCRLLRELIDTGRRQGLRSILANISADQTPSIRLHEKLGFERVAHLRQVGQKFNQWFDAVYLQLFLSARQPLEPRAAAAASRAAADALQGSSRSSA
jgi:L-amino acid N-acyltransferase